VTLEPIVGHTVRSGDGARVGRVFGFMARRKGRNLYVTHVCVGTFAWLETLWPESRLRQALRVCRTRKIPWTAIASIDSEVRLRPEWTMARCQALRAPRART
jgi:hypothetical protein